MCGVPHACDVRGLGPTRFWTLRLGTSPEFGCLGNLRVWHKTTSRADNPECLSECCAMEEEREAKARTVAKAAKVGCRLCHYVAVRFVHIGCKTVCVSLKGYLTHCNSVSGKSSSGWWPSASTNSGKGKGDSQGSKGGKGGSKGTDKGKPVATGWWPSGSPLEQHKKHKRGRADDAVADHTEQETNHKKAKAEQTPLKFKTKDSSSAKKTKKEKKDKKAKKEKKEKEEDVNPGQNFGFCLDTKPTQNLKIR